MPPPFFWCPPHGRPPGAPRRCLSESAAISVRNQEARLVGRRRWRPATRVRQPSINAPRKPNATNTKAKAIPCPDTTRNVIPTTTVTKHTMSPPRKDVEERCQMTNASQPTTSPETNGHAVETIPAMLRPWSCTDRPIPTKRRTAARSITAAERRMSTPRYRLATSSLLTHGRPCLHVQGDHDDMVLHFTSEMSCHDGCRAMLTPWAG
jgi:hypothetical protein